MKPTRTDLFRSLKDYSRAYGQVAVCSLLEAVAGVSTPSKLSPTQWLAVIIAANEGKVFRPKASGINEPPSWDELARETYEARRRSR